MKGKQQICGLVFVFNEVNCICDTGYRLRELGAHHEALISGVEAAGEAMGRPEAEVEISKSLAIDIYIFVF